MRGLLFCRFATSFARKDRPNRLNRGLTFSPSKEVQMRALSFFLIALVAASNGIAHAQMKLSTKPAPGANEVRYFTAIDGLMDGNADVILKETRQGKTLTAATLDVCYSVTKGSDRKDRFVVNLAINGQALTGTTQSIGG